MIRSLFLICFFIALTSGAEAQLVAIEKLDSLPVFKSLDAALKNPDQVYRLDLSKQKLKEFPKEIFRFKNLNELILDKNKITEIPDSIFTLKNLQKFSAERNEIEVFNIKITKLGNLVKLNLADNLIETIPDQIDDLEKLQYLILWDNPISYYPLSFANMTALKYLDLLNNQMNAQTQQRLKTALPDCRIIFSPPCNCMDGME